MAEQNNETLRQMLSGFSAMQYNLGLLPMPQSQAMAGAPAPFQAAPPPPHIPHPSEAAMSAMHAHQNMVQQTLQAAQATRYQPPPSAALPSIGAMSMYGGSGGGGGGGYAPFVGGSVGPLGGGGSGGMGGGTPFAPRMPSVFNPFSPTMPAAHFASPAMRNMQMMQHAQTQTMSMMSGVGEGAMGIGGAAVGGMLGSALGPLGTIGGAYLGSKIGGAVSSMIFNPVTQDFARGRQIQSMTSPFMVSGANLNMMTGQGMDAQGARAAATGIRKLQLDHDFERTGFNTADTMRIMQSSAGAGLLTGAQSPDQMVQKVKEISKTVKMLMKITGDPDVRDAIASLGQMRDMGFQGLAAQAGAVANRASFARMAGVSQHAMQGIMAGGADMAGQFGLAGATGGMAAMQGAASANMAMSSGSLNDLQLARAGGRAGLGNINAMAQLSAVSNDQYMLAAMGRDSKGRMTVDMEAFRKAQSMSFGDVQKAAAETLRGMGTQGMFEWNTRRQEFKDHVAQKLSPVERQTMILQQARAFQGQFKPGEMSMGTAIQQVSQGALSADQARALELQFQNRGYWDAQIQQMRVQKRDAQDQERAHREQYRTPGLMTRMGRGAREFMGDVSDTLSSPFRGMSNHFERVREDEEAAGRGERISRYGDLDIAHNDAERQMMRSSMKRGDLRQAYNRSGGNFLTEAEGDRSLGGAFSRSAGRQMNRIGSFFGLSAQSNANRLVSVADYSRGRYTSLGESFGDPSAAMGRVADVVEAAQGANRAPLSGSEINVLTQRITDAGGGKEVGGLAVLAGTTANVVDILKSHKAGYMKSARALSGSDVKSAFVKAALAKGMKQGEAEKAWEANKSQIMAHVSKDIYASGDKKLIEPWEKAKEVQSRAGGVDLTQSRDAAEADIKDKLRMAGLDGVSDDTLNKLKSVVAHHDTKTVALAAAIAAQTSGNDEEKRRGRAVIEEFEKTTPKDKQGEIYREAQELAGSMDSKTKDAAEKMLRGTNGLQGMEATIGIAKSAFGGKMELAARTELQQRLDDVHKGAGGAASVEKSIGMISDSDLDRMEAKGQKKFADQIRAAKKGGAGGAAAISKMIEDAGPGGKMSRHGGAEGGAIDALDRQIASLEQARDEYSKSQDETMGGPGSAEGLQAQSTTLFATAVKDFTAAVKTMKGEGENATLNWSNPMVMSKLLEK